MPSLAATLTLASLAPGLGVAAPSPVQIKPVAATAAPAAGRGADDGPNHDVNDDRGRRGRDGGKGRGRGRDDGPRHG